MNRIFAAIASGILIGALFLAGLLAANSGQASSPLPEQINIRVEVIQPAGEEGGGDEFPGQRRGGGTHADDAPAQPAE